MDQTKTITDGSRAYVVCKEFGEANMSQDESIRGRKRRVTFATAEARPEVRAQLKHLRRAKKRTKAANDLDKAAKAWGTFSSIQSFHTGEEHYMGSTENCKPYLRIA